MYFMTLILVSCGIYRLNARCYQDNCLQCEYGPCTKCSYGWYGADCSLRCVRCQTDGCEQFTGICVQCLSGIYGDSCNIPCPTNCAADNYTGATFCNRSTGLCLDGCNMSFWGSHCDQSCSKNCLQAVCVQMKRECLYGCIDGFYGDECVKQCPKNCQNKCSYLFGNCDTCKHGFSGSKCDISCENCVDNECTYNELDETLSCTHGCKDGWTSGNCSVRCSERCKDQLCEEDGKCTACPVGYVGDRCMEAKTSPSPNGDREDLPQPGKYASHGCRDDPHSWQGYFTFILMYMTLMD